WPNSVNQTRLRVIVHRNWADACVVMYRACAFTPEAITPPATLYRPSLVLSRQKNAGLTDNETDFLSFRSAMGCNAIRLRLANSSAKLKYGPFSYMESN